MNCFQYFEDIHNHFTLGNYYAHEFGLTDELEKVNSPLAKNIDYKSFGQDILLESGGIFTDSVYITSTGETFTSFFDFDTDLIPEEYKV